MSGCHGCSDIFFAQIGNLFSSIRVARFVTAVFHNFKHETNVS